MLLISLAEGTEAECFHNQVALPCSFSKKAVKLVKNFLALSMEDPPEV